MKLPGPRGLYAQDVLCRERRRGEPGPSAEDITDKILGWPPRFSSPLVYMPDIIPGTGKMTEFTPVIRLRHRGQLTLRYRDHPDVCDKNHMSPINQLVAEEDIRGEKDLLV